MTFALVLLFSLCRSAVAQSASVELSASTTTAQVGETIELTARAALPPGLKVALDLQRSTTDAFAIAKVEDAGVKEAAGLRAQEFKVAIIPMAVGRVPVALYWNSESGSAETALEAPSVVFLDVPEPAFDAKQPPAPLDIKEPRAARPALWPWLLAAVLGAAAWELYRRRRAAQALVEAQPPVDRRPAEVIALSRLDELETSGLWPERRFKEFYFRLTEVLREYLEKRFGIPATRLTTAELYRHIRQAELDRPLAALFKDIFDRADLVKFAKVAPDEEWGGKDIAGARSLIQQTTPKDLAQEVSP